MLIGFQVTNVPRQQRRLERLAQNGIRQANVLVHDDNRASLEQLRPHLATAESAPILSTLIDALPVRTPVNVAKVRQLSPFRYPGGKTWLVPVAREWLRLLDTPACFLEPFAGGGIISLTAVAENLVDHAIMVEKDDDVAAVWAVLIDGSDHDVETLVARILGFNVTFDNVRSVLNSSPATTVDRAFSTIVKNRCNRGGILAPGAGLTKTGENGRGLNSRWYPETLAKRFVAIRQIRHRITFIHGDAFDLLTTRDFFSAPCFVDPPYTAGGKRAGTRLYKHNDVNHERLFDLIASRPAPALMTYDDTDTARDLANKHGFQLDHVAMKSTHNVAMKELTIFKS